MPYNHSAVNQPFVKIDPSNCRLATRNPEISQIARFRYFPNDCSAIAYKIGAAIDSSLPNANSMTTLQHYSDVQTFIGKVMEDNKKEGAPPPKSPHKAFWATLTYDEFCNGMVPGVKDPGTSASVPILVKGDSRSSNLILALRGEGPLFGPGSPFGQMPAGGASKFTIEQVQAIADWIDAGCPE
jgi:hypothetical protein